MIAKEADEAQYQYFTKDVYSDIECKYIEALSIIIDELKEYAPRTSTPGLSSSSTFNMHQNQTILAQHAQQSVTLPKITIPTFDGKYLDWPSFKDLFSDLIHNNGLLTAVQKLHYLKSSVVSRTGSIIEKHHDYFGQLRVRLEDPSRQI